MSVCFMQSDYDQRLTAHAPLIQWQLFSEAHFVTNKLNVCFISRQQIKHPHINSENMQYEQHTSKMNNIEHRNTDTSKERNTNSINQTHTDTHTVHRLLQINRRAERRHGF